jgi:hypothetical protein
MTKGEFEAMTKDELVAYADDRDIEVHHHWTKDEIIKEIMKAEKAAAKQEAKQDDTQEDAQTQSQQQSATADYPKVDPDLAANQELAQKLPDESTRFAPTAPKEK